MANPPPHAVFSNLYYCRTTELLLGVLCYYELGRAELTQLKKAGDCTKRVVEVAFGTGSRRTR